MGRDRSELRKGLARTRPYLLSHHQPGEYHRCYAPVVFGRRVRVCARCLGIYPGILAGLLSYAIGPWGVDPHLLVAALPAPALFDWTVTTVRDRRGYNGVRTATGWLLGAGYGLGIALVLFETSLVVIGIGFVYATVAVSLLYNAQRGG